MLHPGAISRWLYLLANGPDLARLDLGRLVSQWVGPVVNFLCGAAGAFIYGIGGLIFLWYAESATRDKRSQAIAEFFAAVATGAIFAAGFSGVFTPMVVRGISIGGVSVHADVGESTVALTIGCCSNYLWPKLLRKLGRKIDADVLETPKL